jgi:hypothetical protein
MLGDKVVGDTLSTAEQTAYLAALNTMLESWSIERLLVYQIVEEAFTLVIGSNAYTIGSAGNFNTTRPTKLEDTCFIDYLSTLYPVEVLSERNFTALQTTGLSGMPRNLYYNVAVPLSTIIFDYLPDIAYSFHLKSWKQLQSFAAIGDTVSLPLGYQRAIESNLAIELSPGFISASPELVKVAKESKAAVRSLNNPDSVLRLDLGVAGRHRWNIMSGI